MQNDRAPDDSDAAPSVASAAAPSAAGATSGQLALHARAALLAAASDLRRLVPELGPCRALGYRDSLPGGLIGAYVPIVGSGESFHVGVLSDVVSCELLAGALGRVHEPTERGVRAPLAALVRELGLRFLDHVDPDHLLVLRTSIFVDGFSRHLRAGRVQVVEVVLGSIRATLVLTGADTLRSSEWPSQRALTSTSSERRQ